MLADRVKATSILSVVFMVGVAPPIVLAFEPALTVLIPTFFVIAVLLGLGNGAVFDMVDEHFPTQAGIVGGMIGAIGGLGGFFPPLAMGIVKEVTDSYALGFMLLSGFVLIRLLVNVLVLRGRIQMAVDGR